MMFTFRDKEEQVLWDHFAGLAMQTLLRIGTVCSKNDDNGNDPDMPYYFGEDPVSGCTNRVPDDLCGSESLPWDAYNIAKNMVLMRRRFLDDKDTP